MMRLVLSISVAALWIGPNPALAAEKPILVNLPLMGDESAIEQLPLINAEIYMVLERSGKYRLVSQDELAGHLLMTPEENLAFCKNEPACIAAMGSDVKARWILLGEVKLSFDRRKILIHLLLVDVVGRKLGAEKFGQFDLGSNTVQQSGDLLRQLLGLPLAVRKPKPKPKPEELARPETPRAKQHKRATAAVSEPAAEARISPWKNPLTWTAASVGVAGLATAIAFGAWSRAEVRDAENSAFGGDYDQAKYHVSRAEEAALGANIALGVGSAALTAAVVLLILDLTDQPPAATPTVACSRTGCGAAVAISF